jgi:hypothetical protein
MRKGETCCFLWFIVCTNLYTTSSIDFVLLITRFTFLTNELISAQVLSWCVPLNCNSSYLQHALQSSGLLTTKCYIRNMLQSHSRIPYLIYLLRFTIRVEARVPTKIMSHMPSWGTDQIKTWVCKQCIVCSAYWQSIVCTLKLGEDGLFNILGS